MPFRFIPVFGQRQMMEKSTSEAMGIQKAKNWIEENQVELYWQDSLGQYYGERN